MNECFEVGCRRTTHTTHQHSHCCGKKAARRVFVRCNSRTRSNVFRGGWRTIHQQSHCSGKRVVMSCDAKTHSNVDELSRARCHCGCHWCHLAIARAHVTRQHSRIGLSTSLNLVRCCCGGGDVCVRRAPKVTLLRMWSSKVLPASSFSLSVRCA